MIEYISWCGEKESKELDEIIKAGGNINPIDALNHKADRAIDFCTMLARVLYSQHILNDADIINIVKKISVEVDQAKLISITRNKL